MSERFISHSIGIHNRVFLVTICKKKLKHHFVQMCKSFILHFPLRLHTSGRLVCGKLLCRSRSSRRIVLALESVSNSQSAFCPGVICFQLVLIVRNIGLNVDNVNQCLLVRILNSKNFQLIVSCFNFYAFRKRDIAAALEKLFLDFSAEFFDAFLLIGNNVNIADAKESSLSCNVSAQNKRESFRLVNRNHGRDQISRHHDRFAGIIVFLHTSIRVQNGFIRPILHCRKNFISNRYAFGKLLHINSSFFKLLASAMANIPDFQTAAFFADNFAAGIIVRKIFQNLISDPRKHANNAVFPVIHNILRNKTRDGGFFISTNLRRFFHIFFDFNAVFLLQIILVLRHKDKNVTHLVNVINSRLRNDLTRMTFRYGYVAKSTMIPVVRLPFHMVNVAALNRYSAFTLIVHCRKV